MLRVGFCCYRCFAFFFSGRWDLALHVCWGGGGGGVGDMRILASEEANGTGYLCKRETKIVIRASTYSRPTLCQPLFQVLYVQWSYFWKITALGDFEVLVKQEESAALFGGGKLISGHHRACEGLAWGGIGGCRILWRRAECSSPPPNRKSRRGNGSVATNILGGFTRAVEY